jgi:hypothetical protein
LDLIAWTCRAGSTKRHFLIGSFLGAAVGVSGDTGLITF